MKYTCTRDFSTQGRDFTTGDKINATDYIALNAEERANFKQDNPDFKEFCDLYRNKLRGSTTRDERMKRVQEFRRGIF